MTCAAENNLGRKRLNASQWKSRSWQPHLMPVYKYKPAVRILSFSSPIHFSGWDLCCRHSSSYQCSVTRCFTVLLLDQYREWFARTTFMMTTYLGGLIKAGKFNLAIRTTWQGHSHFALPSVIRIHDWALVILFWVAALAQLRLIPAHRQVVLVTLSKMTHFIQKQESIMFQQWLNSQKIMLLQLSPYWKIHRE